MSSNDIGEYMLANNSSDITINLPYDPEINNLRVNYMQTPPQNGNLHYNESNGQMGVWTGQDWQPLESNGSSGGTTSFTLWSEYDEIKKEIQELKSMLKQVLDQCGVIIKDESL